MAKGVELTAADLRKVQRTVMECMAAGPVILAGDFNLPSHYPEIPAATAGLKDTFSANGYGWGKTVPSWLPALRIDMIFVPQAAHVYYAAAMPTACSDHRPVIAEIGLRR